MAIVKTGQIPQQRIALPVVKDAYYQRVLRLVDVLPFFLDHPAEQFVSLELVPDAGGDFVRIGMMNLKNLRHGTFARIERAAVTVRGFYQGKSAAYLTGKRLASSITEFRSLFDRVIEALLAVRLADGKPAKWISFHGVNDSCFAFDGTSWRSMIPSTWMSQEYRMKNTELCQTPSARIVGLMDGYAYAISMEIQREGQDDADSTLVRPFAQRIELHSCLHPSSESAQWKKFIIVHQRPRVHGVGFMARLKTPAPPLDKRPRSGYMPMPDSMFTHITYADRTVSTCRYYPGESVHVLSQPVMIDGWPTPPTVLAVVRPNPALPAEGLIVQELQEDRSCLLHYLAPDQVPEPYRPYLESLRP